MTEQTEVVSMKSRTQIARVGLLVSAVLSVVPLVHAPPEGSMPLLTGSLWLWGAVLVSCVGGGAVDAWTAARSPPKPPGA